MDRPPQLQILASEGFASPETHVTKSWKGVSAQFCSSYVSAAYDFKWDGSRHYLAYHDLVLADGEMEVLGEPQVRGKDLRDLMTYVPAGQPISGWAKPVQRGNAFTVVCFDPAAIETELQKELDGLELRPSIYFRELELGVTMVKLGRVMAEQNGPGIAIYAETLGLGAALETLRMSTRDAGRYRPGESGQLSKSQCELVRTYVEDHLSREIGLEELAAICGLTRFHFSRAFKATFGAPPYRYVMHRRIGKAKLMLVSSKLPISEIAAACGFNGSSQFGRSFRDVVGQTPMAFRRSA